MVVAPSDLLEILRDIDFETALAVGDQRYVDTTAARGSEHTRERLAKKLGVDPRTDRFLPPTSRHILLFGHRGSGKTTELRVALERLREGRLLIVDVDIATVLDRNNAQYADLLVAMARATFENLRHLSMRQEELQPIEDWLFTQVIDRSESRDFMAELKTSARGGLNVPFLADLFARFTTAFKTNHQAKESFRREIRGTFSTLAELFNRFLRDAEAQLHQKTGDEQRIVFAIDGTDKLSSEDTKRLFVADVEQLLAIDALIVYTAPIALKYDGNLTSRLHDIVLPMIKLYTREGARFEPGWEAMRSILLGRADRAAFADEQAIENLIEGSGGHPRDMLRLLQIACEYADQKVDVTSVERALDALARDHQRYLLEEDYVELAKVDAGKAHDGHRPNTHRLLLNLALLEYNDGSWRRSHPVIRRLDRYKHEKMRA
jgi:hypothetical protein